MKRAFVFVLVTALVLSCLTISAYADSNTMQIESRLLTNVDSTASEWYETEEYRALFCSAAMMEVLLTENEEYTTPILDALTEGRCFMAKTGLSISAYYIATDSIVLVLYKPLTKSLEAGVIEINAISYADELMEGLKEDGEINSYYEVDTGDVVTMAQLLLESSN